MNVLLEEIEKITNSGVYQTDLTTGTWVGSDNFIKIFGLEKKEKYAIEEFQALVHPEDFQEVMTYFGECLANQKNFNYEYRCLKSDGSIIHVNSQSQIFYNENGTPLKILGVKQDITKLRKREEKLIALNKKLQELNTKKNKIIGAVAHDLQNPIAAIEGLTHLLKDNLNEEQLELIMLQEDALNSTKTLISELLEVATLSKNSTSPKKTKSDLNQLIYKSIQQFQTKAFNKNITIVPNLTNNAIVPLFPDKFSRVIDNLLSNALKFTPEQKSIYIKTISKENHLVLIIKDEGIGIPEQSVPLLLDEIPANLKRQGIGGEKSNGLGLSIVKEILNLHDATIQIKSKENEGTTVEIRLKRA